jgi:hypothetical protein
MAELNKTIGSSQQKRRLELQVEKELAAVASEDKRRSVLSKEKRRSIMSKEERRLSRLSKQEHRLSQLSQKEHRHSQHLSIYSLNSMDNTEASSDWEDIELDDESVPDTEEGASSHRDSRSYMTQSARVITYRKIDQHELCLKSMPRVELPTQATPKSAQKEQFVQSPMEAGRRPRTLAKFVPKEKFPFGPRDAGILSKQREIGIESLPDELTGRRTVEEEKYVSIQTHDWRETTGPTTAEKQPEPDHKSQEEAEVEAEAVHPDVTVSRWKKFVTEVRKSSFSLALAMDPGAAAAAAVQRDTRNFFA